MSRIAISIESVELDGSRDYSPLVRRLSSHDAIPVGRMQWILQTSLTVEQIRHDIQNYIDPADRLLVTQVASMSSRNLINADKIGRGAA